MQIGTAAGAGQQEQTEGSGVATNAMQEIELDCLESLGGIGKVTSTAERPEDTGVVTDAVGGLYEQSQLSLPAGDATPHVEAAPAGSAGN